MTNPKEILKAARKQKRRNISALARQFNCSRTWIYKIVNKKV